jgi:hypothetical protein
MARTYTPRSKAPAAHEKFKREMTRKHEHGKKTKVSELPRRELLVVFYKAQGFSVVQGRSAKFITMEKPGYEKKYFIGKNGSLAFGKNVSTKISLPVDFGKLRRWLNQQVRNAKGG